MSKLLYRIILIMLLAPGGLSGQNKYIPPDPYTQADGVTHWSRYQVMAPGYLGPNALPVPRIHKAEVPRRFFWTGLYEYYSGPGDQTHDFKVHFVIPVAEGRVGLEFNYVPVEFYSMDQPVSRHRRTESGAAIKGEALGDVYFGTQVQLIREHRFLPDVSFAMTCRTASGTGREDARYTNTPGYYLDASFGDTYGKDRGFFRNFRWYLDVGFYVWQTYLDNYPQNDALLYGVGMDFDFKDFFINQSLSGYSGYMNNGDQPVVYRIDAGMKLGSGAFVVGYEKGLNDFPFRSIRAGFQIEGLTEKR